MKNQNLMELFDALPFLRVAELFPKVAAIDSRKRLGVMKDCNIVINLGRR